MTEPVVLCNVCRKAECGHTDLEYAGLVPANSRASNLRKPVPPAQHGQGSSEKGL